MRSTSTWSPMSRVFSIDDGRNLEVLEDEGQGEEADDQDAADGSKASRGVSSTLRALLWSSSFRGLVPCAMPVVSLGSCGKS